MEFIQKTKLSKIDRIRILELWNNEYPEKLTFATLNNFEAYLENLSEQSHIIVFDQKGNIIAWYFDFVREKEKWFALILDSKFHRMGLGTKLLKRVKQEKVELNGWVIDHNNDRKRNGDTYTSPLEFYLKNGFEQISDNRLELDNISAVQIKWTR